MTMFLAPYTAIADIDGSPLDAGFIFFGEFGKNPESFPISVYWDADFAIPAAQPIRTRNGYPIRNGSPCKIYLKQAEHSLAIKNKNLSAILVEMNNKGISSSLLVRPNGDTVETSLTNIDAELNDKQQQIDEKPSQQYVDEKLDLKAPQETTYTKLEVDSALSAKAPQETTYTKLETDVKFSAYVGGRKGFTTLALAQAGQSTLTTNTVVDVTNDPDPTKNGTYQWNGTTLTKSDYDPLTQAKAYTDENLSPLLVEIQEDFNLSLSAGYLSKAHGGFLDTNSYRSSQLLPCSPADEIYVTVAPQSALMAGVCYYNSDGEFISFELEGSGARILYSDYKLTIPTDAAFFALSTLRDDTPTAYKPVYEVDVFTRQQSDSRYEAKGGATSQFYGIRWDISSSASACERTGAAVGLTSQTMIGDGPAAGSNDFDSTYPWSDIRRCAIRVLASGAPKLLYEGEDGYAEDGSAGDVFYEIPRFGYERKIVDGYEYRTIARDGLEPHPAFVEPGVVLENIYVSAYNAAEEEGVLQSLPGTLPTMNQTAQELLDKATVKGRGFTLLDMRTLDALQNLLWIEHATRNSTDVIGHGFAELKQARDNTWPITEAAASTNTLVITPVGGLTPNNKEQLFTGQDIIICGVNQYDIIARRKLIGVTFDSPTTDAATLEIDGDPIDVTAGWFAGSSPQTTGQTDAMEYHTGRLDRPKFEPTSTIPRNEMNANRYRGIENLVGDVWRLLPDVTYSDGNMYVCRDITAYQFHSIETPYYPVALDVPLQEVNDDGSWVQSLGFDNIRPSIAVAESFGAANSGSYFGAFHYLNPGLVCIAHGGGFDHKKRCNLLTYRAWIMPTSIWYLYGGRLLFKPI